jgi:hypothetical protein
MGSVAIRNGIAKREKSKHCPQGTYLDRRLCLVFKQGGLWVPRQVMLTTFMKEFL